MKRLRYVHLILLIVICGVTLRVDAKTLKVAVGSSIPPYVIGGENRGIEFDILKEVLALQGYVMQPVYVPLTRTLHLLENDRVDGIMSTGRAGLPGCYTDSHITYWNFAITLKDRNIRLNDIADLQGKRILSFQNAKDYLGADFRQMADKNPHYREIADQSLQIKLLFSRRTDVVVADRYIFEWYRNDPKVGALVNVEQEVEYHKIFSPGNFKAVFKDDVVCEAFNQGLKLLKEKGRYDEIIRSYGVINPAFVN